MPKISGLPVTTTPTGADILPIVQSGTTKQTTFAKLPISDAVTTALALKADSSNLNKTFIGLGNVDNTSDANKPVSTAQQTAMNGLNMVKNKIRNGAFQINQRAVSGTVTLAAGAYGHDGWKAGAGGCTYTFAASGNRNVITISAGSLMQVVESLIIEAGQYTLSHSGTAQARIAINGAATSGNYAALPQTTSAATGNQTITVEFTTGTVDQVQLEPGTLATAFERRQYSNELAICQRRCVRWTSTTRGDVAVGLSYTTVSAAFTVQLPVPMASTPNISSAALAVTNGAGAQLGGTSAAVSNFTGLSVNINIGVSAGLTVGQASILSVGTGAGGFLQLECEL